MKVLLINNNTYYKNRLQDLLKRHELTIINYDQVAGYDIEPFDVIVLSGGRQEKVPKEVLAFV